MNMELKLKGRFDRLGIQQFKFWDFEDCLDVRWK